MTSKVTVDPAGHHLHVALGSMGAPEPSENHFLAPGQPPHYFWIYGDRVISVTEISKEEYDTGVDSLAAKNAAIINSQG